MKKRFFMLGNPPDDEKKYFDTIEELIGYAIENNIQNFKVKSEEDEGFKRFIIGELLYKPSVNEVIAIRRLSNDSPTTFESSENFDCIVNPYLKKLVYDRFRYDDYSRFSICGSARKNFITGEHAFIRAVVEAIQVRKNIIKDEKNETYIAIGQREGDIIYLIDNEKLYSGSVPEHGVKYEDISSLFDIEGIRFI